MISDEERREIAEQLRACSNCGGIEQCDECQELSLRLFSDTQALCQLDSNGVNCWEELADLIDRPTCRIVHDENRDCYVCTNCSTSFELAEFDYADANVFEGYSYCPKCGAEVVEDD